jgi:P27 family predicted phage terminase small subunit
MLTGADLGLLAGYCEAFGRFADATKLFAEIGSPYVITTDKGLEMAHPLLKIIDMAERTMRMYAAEFGMSPAARPKISLPKRRDSAPGDPLQ